MSKLCIGIMGTRGIPNRYGGFEQFAEQLAVALVQRGHAVTVYCPASHPAQQPEWQGVQLVYCNDRSLFGNTFGQFRYDLACLADAGKRNFDVLLHLGYTSDSIWHRRWSPAMKHVVNMDGMEWKRSKYNFFTRRFLQKAESWAAMRADKMVADSTAIQSILEKKYKRLPVYIPYSAAPFRSPDPQLLASLAVHPRQYLLVIARLEPENNIEMMLEGYGQSNCTDPLLIVGNIATRYGAKLLQQAKKYKGIRFLGAIYNQPLLDNLRYFSLLYLHGHSVGGTNPSLLEAMACQCNLLAHDNVFNRAVLGEHAGYFASAAALSRQLNLQVQFEANKAHIRANLEKLQTIFHPANITSRYEHLFYEVTGIAAEG